MKNQMWKKGVCLGMAAMMTAGMLAGCGESSESKDTAMVQTGEDGVVESGRYTLDADTPAWKLDTKEDTTLTWYVNAEWWNTEWGNDVVTKQIQKDMNVNIDFVVGDDTKLNTFFAGGDMPDIITIFDASSSVAQKADTWAYALQDLADNYDPYFYKVASAQTLSWFAMDDGKTYGYPDYSNTQEDYDSGEIYAKTAFVIRNDVYEALGKPSMGTQEEFLDVLNQIKEQFPDLIPLGFNNFETDGTSSLGDKLQDFLGTPIVNDDNTFYDRDMDEDYLSWIKTLNQAYKNGCISDDSFTDDNTAWQEKESIGKYACIMMEGTPQQAGFLTTFATSNPDAAYIAIDGPKSTAGYEPKLNQAGISGWMITYVSKTCKDPAKAIQLYGEFDLILGGALSADGATGQVAAMVAEELNLPHVVEIQSVKYKEDQAGKVEVVKKMHDTSFRIACATPAVLSVNFGCNEPRLATLRSKRAAKSKPLVTYTNAELGFAAEEVGIKGSPTVTVDSFQPETKRSAKMLTGTPAELAKQLGCKVVEISALKNKGIIVGKDVQLLALKRSTPSELYEFE